LRTEIAQANIPGETEANNHSQYSTQSSGSRAFVTRCRNSSCAVCAIQNL